MGSTQLGVQGKLAQWQTMAFVVLELHRLPRFSVILGWVYKFYLDFPLLSLDDPLSAIKAALSFKGSDIYTCSWGPPDDGKSFGGLSPDILRVVLSQITYGRAGRGAIYVVAAGNGGMAGDHCGADGFAISPFFISVGALTHMDRPPGYAEKCPSMNIITYSSSDISLNVNIKKKSIYFSGITTSDGSQGCTGSHGGTSAAAPIAAASIALLLSQRPDLSWRDVQSLLIKSATPVNEQTKYDEYTAFGKLNVERLITLGDSWAPLNSPSFFSMPSNGNIEWESERSLVYTFSMNVALEIEQVLVKNNLAFLERGYMEFSLISPEGTESFLLRERPRDTLPPRYTDVDYFDTPLKGWVFSSLAFFGENSLGIWRLRVQSSQLSTYGDSFFAASEMWLGFISECTEVNPYKQEVKFARQIFSFYFPQQEFEISSSLERDWIFSPMPLMIFLALMTSLFFVILFNNKRLFEYTSQM